MLGLLGLMGVMMAGVAADALLNIDKPGDAEDSDDLAAGVSGAGDDGTGELDHGDGDMLDWLDAVPAFGEGEAPDSDDLGPDPDPDRDTAGDDGPDTLAGDDGADTLSGWGGDDQLVGRGGGDVVDGGAGRDHAYAGSGDDDLSGGAGSDTLIGEAGHDTLRGDDGDDVLAGQDGDDALDGGAGDDALQGGEGDDTLVGGSGDDWLAGGNGDDSLTGGTGSDTLDGGAGQDVIDGRKPDGGAEVGGGAAGLSDFLNAGAGDDRLILDGDDIASGEEGADTFVLGHWIAQGSFARIQDYDPDEDEIMIVYDPQAHPDPELTLARTADDDDVTVFLDGQPLAWVRNGAGLTAADIRLSTAMPA